MAVSDYDLTCAWKQVLTLSKLEAGQTVTVLTGADTHPQTLRTYERLGLITPGRTSGGGRRYSSRDLDRLREIADLTGLEYATNLTELDLYHNQISDLTPLAKLTELTELILHFNQIADVTPLGKLTNLVSLGLQTNKITDVTPLAELTNLKTLWISNNHFITDDQKEMLKKALPNCEISF